MGEREKGGSSRSPPPAPGLDSPLPEGTAQEVHQPGMEHFERQFLKKKLYRVSSDDTALVGAPWYLPEGAGNVCPHKKSGPWLFITALLRTEAAKVPSGGERINQLWSSQTMDYYSALKRHKLWSHGKKEEL